MLPVREKWYKPVNDVKISPFSSGLEKDASSGLLNWPWAVLPWTQSPSEKAEFWPKILVNTPPLLRWHYLCNAPNRLVRPFQAYRWHRHSTCCKGHRSDQGRIQFDGYTFGEELNLKRCFDVSGLPSVLQGGDSIDIMGMKLGTKLGVILGCVLVRVPNIMPCFVPSFEPRMSIESPPQTSSQSPILEGRAPRQFVVPIVKSTVSYSWILVICFGWLSYYSRMKKALNIFRPIPICLHLEKHRMYLISVYVDASPNCNQLTFQIGTMAENIFRPSSVTPNWVIKVSNHTSFVVCKYFFFWFEQTLEGSYYHSCFHKEISFYKVTQYNCDYTNKAPPGCNQYFTGLSGEVKSFNYQDGGNSGLHLASQDQTICVRLVQSRWISISISGAH